MIIVHAIHQAVFIRLLETLDTGSIVQTAIKRLKMSFIITMSQMIFTDSKPRSIEQGFYIRILLILEQLVASFWC